MKPWVRIDDDILRHPKVVGLTSAAKLAFLESICVAHQHDRDGLIVDAAVRSFANSKTRRELVEAVLWHELDSGIRVHDYLDYQESREQRRERSEAGRRGGLATTEAKREAAVRNLSRANEARQAISQATLGNASQATLGKREPTSDTKNENFRPESRFAKALKPSSKAKPSQANSQHKDKDQDKDKNQNQNQSAKGSSGNNLGEVTFNGDHQLTAEQHEQLKAFTARAKAPHE